MVIQPKNYWYGAITTERIDEILDALEEGNAVDEYLISELKKYSVSVFSF